MADLEKAFEIRDALRICTTADIGCGECAYKENGCAQTLMLEAASIIENLILEVPTEDSCEACKIGGAEDGQR